MFPINTNISIRKPNNFNAIDISIPWKSPLYSDKTFVALKGGRGGGKSIAIASYFINQSFNKNFRGSYFIAMRYFKVNAISGSMMLIKSIIKEHNLLDFFTIKGDMIVNNFSGIYILPEGAADCSFITLGKLKGHNLASLIWFEEANEISLTAINTIVPSVRFKGARFFFSFNPLLSSDSPIAFCTGKRNASIVHGNLFDLPEKLQNPALLDLAKSDINNPNYNHIWLGALKAEQESCPFLKVKTKAFSFVGGSRVYGFLDPSFKGGDYSALSLVQINSAEEEILVKGYIFKESWIDSLSKVYNLLYVNNVEIFWYESNVIGDSLRDLMYTKHNCIAKGVYSKESKVSRIAKAAPYGPNIHLNNSLQCLEYNRQVIEYNYSAKGGYDDAPDSLSNCLINIMQIYDF